MNYDRELYRYKLHTEGSDYYCRRKSHRRNFENNTTSPIILTKEVVKTDIFPILQIMVIDLRTVSFDVPPQEILTRDSVTVAVDAVVYYKIGSPMAAVCNVEDYAKSTKLLAATTLRTILGTRSLSEILSDRENISEMMMIQIDKATDPWGVKVRNSTFYRDK